MTSTLTEAGPFSVAGDHHFGTKKPSPRTATIAANATFRDLGFFVIFAVPIDAADATLTGLAASLFRSLLRTSSNSPQFWTRSASGSLRQRSIASSRLGLKRPVPNSRADGSGSLCPPSAA